MAQVRSVDGHGGPTFEIAIYRTSALDDRNGTIPGFVAVNYLADGLDEIGVNCRIYYDFIPVELGTQDPSCPSDDNNNLLAYEEWEHYLDSFAPFIAADSNICLLDNNGGGCGAVGGNFSVAGASQIDHYEDLPSGVRGDHYAGNIYAIMHEVGHNMGWGHDPHPGDSYNASNYWHRTPCVGTGLGDHPDRWENICGDDIEPSLSNDIINLLHYHDCVADEMDIEGASPWQVTNLDADTDMVVDQPATVSVEVQNRTPVEETVEFTIIADRGSNRDSFVVGTFTETIPGPGTETADFSWTPEQTGDHTIIAGDAEIVRDVQSAGSLTVTSLSADPSEPTVGETVDIDGTIENTTPDFETRDVTVFLTPGEQGQIDQAIGTFTFVVSGGATDDEQIEWTPSVPGDYTIIAGATSIEITVAEEATGEVRINSVGVQGSGQPRVGEQSIVSVAAENTGTAGAERTITVTAGGRSLGTVTFALSAGESASRTVTWEPTSEGQVTLRAGTAETSVEVEPGSSDPPENGGIIPGPALPALAGGALFLLFFVGRPEEPE